jgi:hypothetical protein
MLSPIKLFIEGEGAFLDTFFMTKGCRGCFENNFNGHYIKF